MSSGVVGRERPTAALADVRVRVVQRPPAAPGAGPSLSSGQQAAGRERAKVPRRVGGPLTSEGGPGGSAVAGRCGFGQGKEAEAASSASGARAARDCGRPDRRRRAARAGGRRRHAHASGVAERQAESVRRLEALRRARGGSSPEKIGVPSAEVTSVQESCSNSRTIETPPSVFSGAACAGCSSCIAGAGPGETATFLKLTGAMWRCCDRRRRPRCAARAARSGRARGGSP